MAAENALRMGARIKEMRIAAGISQDELARRTSFDQSTVSRVERGETDLPVSRLIELAAFFGVTPGSLVDGTAAIALPTVTIGSSVTCGYHGLLGSGLTADEARQIRAEHIREHLAGDDD